MSRFSVVRVKTETLTVEDLNKSSVDGAVTHHRNLSPTRGSSSFHDLLNRRVSLTTKGGRIDTDIPCCTNSNGLSTLVLSMSFTCLSWKPITLKLSTLSDTLVLYGQNRSTGSEPTGLVGRWKLHTVASLRIKFCPEYNLRCTSNIEVFQVLRRIQYTIRTGDGVTPV